jgi:predicted dehydrogenase
MKKKFKVGVIGLGVGERHLEAYIKFGCEVKKIYDINKDKMLKIKKKYPKIEISKSENDLINDKEIDIVSIASYDNDHYQQIVKCIKNKKNIFVEKPVVLSELHAKNVNKLLNKNKNVFFYCNFILSESPVFKKIKSDIKKNRYGKLFKIDADYNYGRIKKITEGWRSKIPFYSVTLGGGIHLVDLLNWISNSRVKEIKSFANKICTYKTKFKYKDCVISLLKYENNMIAKISSNFGCVYPHFHKLTIYGTKKTFENDIKHIRIFEDRESKRIKEFNNDYKNYFKGNAIKVFLDSIGNYKTRKILIKRVFESLMICFGIEKSIKTNKNVKINYFS